jgi:hypothetical protein
MKTLLMTFMLIVSAQAAELPMVEEMTVETQKMVAVTEQKQNLEVALQDFVGPRMEPQRGPAIIEVIAEPISNASRAISSEQKL